MVNPPLIVTLFRHVFPTYYDQIPKGFTAVSYILLLCTYLKYITRRFALRAVPLALTRKNVTEWQDVVVQHMVQHSTVGANRRLANAKSSMLQENTGCRKHIRTYFFDVYESESTARHGTAQHGTARRCTALRSAALCCAAALMGGETLSVCAAGKKRKEKVEIFGARNDAGRYR